MTWLSVALALLKLAGAIADYMRQKSLLDAGAKAQIGKQMIELNRRLDIGLKIQNENRPIDDSVDELRRGGGL